MLRKFLSLFRRRPVEVVIRLESRRSMHRREEVEARCMQRFGVPGQLRLVYPAAA